MLIDLPWNYATGQNIQSSQCNRYINENEEETQTTGASEFKYLLGIAY